MNAEQAPKPTMQEPTRPGSWEGRSWWNGTSEQVPSDLPGYWRRHVSNRTMIGWANYFCLGPVSKAYRAVESHARKRLLQWLCAKHKLVFPAAQRFPEASLHEVLGLVCLTKRTSNLPWATS